MKRKIVHKKKKPSLPEATRLGTGEFVRLPGGLILGEVPVDSISMRQVRFRKMDALQLDALKESILRLGVKAPVIVVPTGKGKYGLVDGHHRYDELNEQGYDTVPVIVLTDKQGKSLSKSEADLAMHRFNLSAHEDGPNYLKVLRDLTNEGVSAKDIALATAKDERTIQDMLASFDAAYGGGMEEVDGVPTENVRSYDGATPFGAAMEDVPDHESSRGSPFMIALPNTDEVQDLLESAVEMFGAVTPGDAVLAALRTVCK